MAEINIVNTNIEGVYIIEPLAFRDDRGIMFEAYNELEFSKKGLNTHFVQDNETISKKNVLRGMHVNYNHPQAKLIRVLDGEILDVIIDLRKNSKTYMKCFSIVLSDENRKQLYIPKSVGHGYLALKNSRVLIKTDTHYIPDDEINFAWNSKAIDVKWNIDKPILNERDYNSKDLSEVLL